MSSYYAPGFPVLVIKENESIIVETEKNKGYDKLNTRIIANKRGEKVSFTFDTYDKSRDKNSRIGSASEFDPKFITAYNINLNTDGWQRDFIYYNMSPTQNTGTVNVNFKETIKSFRMMGDPIAAFNKIADQTGDPSYSSSTRSPSNPWSEGRFDFNVKVFLNKRNGTSETISKGFGLSGQDLFQLTYVKDYWLFGWVYKISDVQLKTATNVFIPLFTWDIYNIASDIKISFEEVDPSQTITTNTSVSADLANNFEINATVMKVGLKYGASTKLAITKTYNVVTSLGNDQLGDVYYNFGEKIIENQITLGSFVRYITKEQSTGFCSVSIEPSQN